MTDPGDYYFDMNELKRLDEEVMMGIKNIGILKGDDDEPMKIDTDKFEQEKAQQAYPNHSADAALANYRAGREVWDTNGDLW